MQNELAEKLFNRIIAEYNKTDVNTNKLNLLFELFESELIESGLNIPADDLDANLLNYESFNKFIAVYNNPELTKDTK